MKVLTTITTYGPSMDVALHKAIAEAHDWMMSGGDWNDSSRERVLYAKLVFIGVSVDLNGYRGDADPDWVFELQEKS